MCDALAVQELDTTDNLVVEPTSLFLSESVLSDDIIKEFTAAGILHD